MMGKISNEPSILGVSKGLASPQSLFRCFSQGDLFLKGKRKKKKKKGRKKCKIMWPVSI